MEYRTLGRTGLEVSEIGFTMTPVEEATRAIRRALELGCNFFCADAGTEEILARSPVAQRKDVFIATRGNGDFSEQHILTGAANSLKRLNRDTLDLFQLDQPPLEKIRDGGIFQPLAKLKKEGKIRFAGISILDQIEGIEALKHGVVDTLEVTYKIMTPAPSRQLFPLAKKNNIGVIIREPLDDSEPLRFLNKDGKRTMAQASLQFVLANDAVTTAVPRCASVAQVEETMGTSTAEPLDEHELEQIFELIAGCYDSKT